MKVYPIRLDEETIKKIERVAKALGTKPTTYVREIVRAKVSRDEKKAKREMK
jgi:predicted DNA-binding protein